MCKLYLFTLLKENVKFNFAIISNKSINKLDCCKINKYIVYDPFDYMFVKNKKIYDINLKIYDNIISKITSKNNDIQQMYIYQYNDRYYLKINEVDNIMICCNQGDMDENKYMVTDILN